MTLEPGDVISTGTPSGVGPLVNGDTVTVTIEGIEFADQPGRGGTGMKLFIDSGNIKDIETLAAIGIIDGVTTNPSLLAKEPGDYKENLKRICDIVEGPVSGEVVATDHDGMMREGQPRSLEAARAHRS